MSSAVEYLFAATLALADQAARKKGWRPRGRTAWVKHDGTIVFFICFEKQRAAVPTGVKVHVVAGTSNRRRKGPAV